MFFMKTEENKSVNSCYFLSYASEFKFFAEHFCIRSYLGTGLLINEPLESDSFASKHKSHKFWGKIVLQTWTSLTGLRFSPTKSYVLLLSYPSSEHCPLPRFYFRHQTHLETSHPQSKQVLPFQTQPFTKIAHFRSLLRRLIRSKCDYGLSLYSSATPSTLNSLNSTHITGTFRATFISKLYCETGELLTNYRRDLL